jgi:hypothetical protein
LPCSALLHLTRRPGPSACPTNQTNYRQLQYELWYVCVIACVREEEEVARTRATTGAALLGRNELSRLSSALGKESLRTPQWGC